MFTARRFSWNVILALSAACFFTGCGQKNNDDEIKYVRDATERKILLMGIGSDPESLDPQLISGVTANNVARALFECLTVPDPKTLAPLPGVAERWDISPDQKTYTFYLRQNAKWSNGDPVTAADFVFAYKRALTPTLAATVTPLFFIIHNAEAYYKKPKLGFENVGVKALDNHTLQLTLENPNDRFLHRLMHPAFGPLNEAILRKHGPIDRRDNVWARVGNCVCNGPFMLQSRKIGNKIIVVKNPHYYNADHVALRAIHFLTIPNPNTEERLFRDGQMHITENVPFPHIMTYYNQHSPYLKINAYLGTFYYIFNVQHKPFDDPRVRRALSLALERSKINGADRVPCKNKPAYNLIPENTGGYYHSEHKIVENVAEAQKLLAEAGYPNGQNFPHVTLLFNTGDGQRFMAEAAQEMWKRNLNINVNLLNQEWKVLLASRREGQFDIIRGQWVADYDDPDTFLEQWTSTSHGNYSRWGDTTFDAQLFEAQRTYDPAKKYALFQACEGLLMRAMPCMPIHSSNSSHLVHTSVQGWHPNLLDWHPYTCIDVVKIQIQ